MLFNYFPVNFPDIFIFYNNIRYSTIILINKQKLEFLKNNEILDSDIIKDVKKIIKIKLNIIYKLLKNGKKR